MDCYAWLYEENKKILERYNKDTTIPNDLRFAIRNALVVCSARDFLVNKLNKIRKVVKDDSDE